LADGSEQTAVEYTQQKKLKASASVPQAVILDQQTTVKQPVALTPAPQAQASSA